MITQSIKLNNAKVVNYERKSMIEKYLDYCDTQMESRVLWYLIPLISLSGGVMPASIFFMLESEWFTFFVPISMLLFFGNIILTIAGQHTRITITGFIITVIFNFVAVILNFL